jgi:hypothetical protein
MFKFRKSHLLILLLIVVLFLVFRNTSGYITGMPVTTDITDSQFSNFFSRMTKLGPELKCNPGSADEVDPKTGERQVMSSYYTGGLLPGGYCDDQQVVNAAANYKLVGPAQVPLGD